MSLTQSSPDRSFSHTALEPTRARRLLPSGAAFAGSAAVFAALYLAAGAPTPQWHFPAWVLTVAFASYSLGLLAALLVTGSLSDHIGRRPVLVTSLLVELGAMLMFVFAPDIGCRAPRGGGVPVPRGGHLRQPRRGR
ncbi:hypothetical protein [Streptomyces sp. NPDC002573]|uniref:hypothetical protein n=1 Tax=Streptomyces sp. NPDC002573 TaxID=3364651 RepID=UPI00367B188D